MLLRHLAATSQAGHLGRALAQAIVPGATLRHGDRYRVETWYCTSRAQGDTPGFPSEDHPFGYRDQPI
eukprot:gene17688-biopygen9887